MKKVKSKERELLIEEDCSVGNSITFTGMDGSIYVEIDNPWAGDTETGFGRTGHISISRDGAEELLEYLREWLEP